jgi:hypothetical protein
MLLLFVLFVSLALAITGAIKSFGRTPGFGVAASLYVPLVSTPGAVGGSGECSNGGCRVGGGGAAKVFSKNLLPHLIVGQFSAASTYFDGGDKCGPRRREGDEKGNCSIFFIDVNVDVGEICDKCVDAGNVGTNRLVFLHAEREKLVF